jgi:hypothetical protein
MALGPGLALADPVMVATYDAGLSRAGPGLLLQHLTKADDPQIEAAVTVLAALKADVLVLTDFDYDHDGAALAALQVRLRAVGLDYPEALALRPNTGIATGLDLDHDGALAGPRDAQAYGRFAGQAGMAILSRLPIDRGHVIDYSTLLWRDLPGANLPPDLAPEAAALQRLSTAGHYAVPIAYAPGKVLTLLIWAATPPIFDGPEDRNGRRNADETALWLRLLEGKLPKAPDPGFYTAPNQPFILIGQPNLDPQDGDGLPQNLHALMARPDVQDPAPRGTAGRVDQGRGDPALDTAVFKNGWGLRLDMILPSRDIAVEGAGVLWPPEADALSAPLATASRHRPVWLRLTLP